MLRKIIPILSLVVQVTVTAHTETLPFSSHYLDRELEVTLYAPELPEPKSSGVALPLLIVLSQDEFSPEELEGLVNAGALPEMVGCFINDPLSHESFCCEQSYMRFISHELTPWIRRQRKVSHHPSKTVLVGTGSTALTATFLALKSPTLFGRVYAVNAPYEWAPDGAKESPCWLSSQYQKCAKLPIHFYLSSSDGGKFSHFCSTLEKKGYHYQVADSSRIEKGLQYLIGSK